jgi:hypothetical protein
VNTTSAYAFLSNKEKQFLSDVAKDVAMVVSTPEKMVYYRERLAEFSNHWKAYKKAYEADRKNKWQPSMGKHSNPLGTIWPIVYGNGWRNSAYFSYNPRNIAQWYPCIRDVRTILGDYALLGVIQDKVLPNCPSIAKDIFPKKLTQEIWRNLLIGVDVEGPNDFKKWAVWARKDKIESFMKSVKVDIEKHFMGRIEAQSSNEDDTSKTQGKGEKTISSSNVTADLLNEKQVEIAQKSEGSKLMITTGKSTENWEIIKKEYSISRRLFRKKINFVKDKFKRKIIFRDVEHAFVLASQCFPKPAIILAGGVIEELLRLYLEHKSINMTSDKFSNYIKSCEDNSLLKSGVLQLTDSVRNFRNLVHLARETDTRHTISKVTAKGAVSSIFTIANDFQ